VVGVIVLTQIPTVPEALGVVLVIAGVAAHTPAANPERKGLTEATPG
jgi:threonine/homoserine efflux transporter RhtA